MKRNLQIIITASAASVLVFSAVAQDAANPKTGQSDYSRQSMARPSGDRLNGAAKASELIGMTVNNYQSEKLGKVEDLAVDVQSGRIVQVIISTGGFLGMGSTLSAVPPGALHHDVANKVLHLDSSKENLAAAPKFDTAKWEECTQSNRVTEVYSYYGEQPYFIGDRDEYGSTNLDGALARTLPRNMDGTINTTGARTMDTAHNVEIARNAETTGSMGENSSTISTRNPDGTWTKKAYSNHNGANYSGSSLGYVQKASKLIGTTVKNLQAEKLGKVENLIVDLSTGRLVAVIISSGGYIGMGDELSAVPPSALKYNTERDTLQLDTSKEALASAPHFKANQWPDLSQPGYVGGVYRAYNVDPYFTTGTTNSFDNTQRNVRDRDSRNLTPLDQGNNHPAIENTDADNTRRNVRDRDNATLTPLDQSNSKTDVSTTTQIRKEIIADQGMSMNAKNVKIITIDGRITLRGPVNSEEEKRLIGEIAERTPHSGSVDNQLEVQATNSKN